MNQVVRFLTRHNPKKVVPECTLSARGYEIKQKDYLKFLKSLPDNSVDLIVTDPPYASQEKYRKIGTKTRLKHSAASSNDWFDVVSNSIYPDFFAECFRVLKKNSHLYVFSDQETMHIMVPAGKQYFKYWKDIIWDKKVIGMGYHYRNRNERILFFEKGKRKLKNLGTPDILEEKRIWKGYPTEKPVPLIEILISQSSDDNMLVMDPFMGSGSTGVAALKLGRRFIGCDRSPKALRLTYSRLKQTAYCPDCPPFVMERPVNNFGDTMKLDNFVELDDYSFNREVDHLVKLVDSGVSKEELKEKIKNFGGMLPNFVEKDFWFFDKCMSTYVDHMENVRRELFYLFRKLHDSKFVLDEYSGEQFDMYDMIDFPTLERFFHLQDFEELLEG